MNDRDASEYATNLIKFWRERGGSARAVEVIVYSEKNKSSYGYIKADKESLYFKDDREITEAALWAYTMSLNSSDKSQHSHVLVFMDDQIELCFRWK